MRTFDLSAPLPADFRGASIALGNFDGLHAGHRAVIGAAQAAAGRLGAPCIVATFDPAPRRVFQPDAPPFRIFTGLRRDLTLATLGIDGCVLVPFDRAMAAMTDAEFAEDVLVRQLGLRSIAVGADFQFGRKRMGDVESLKRLGASLAFEVIAIEPVADLEAPEADKLSSTRIRGLIEGGDMEAAGRELGQLWTIDALVEHGEKRGRTLGFPTANMTLGEIVNPAHGIYAVWVRRDEEAVWRPGVANFGRTPTTGLRDPLLEVVILDWAGDLYGTRLHTAFVKFLRPEARFDSLEALVEQMYLDTEQARAILSQTPPPAGL
jgi:riboflavin kinase/FMN adenylyltransferase